jgi:plasmid maintenance system antidote protein VapI
MQRKPSHPGEMLREDFLPDYGLTVSGLAESLGVSRQSIIVDFLTP